MDAEGVHQRAEVGVKNAARPHILLVSEDEENLARYRRLLSGLKGEIITSGSYSDAAEILGRQAFDLVVVGQGTPAFEGCRVLQRARELHLNVPIVVISRVADMDCYIRAMELGAVDYFESVTTPRQLLGLLDVYLNLRQAA
jgi:DNA-binding NtrC family response regulator